MNFLSSLGNIINDQFGIGENTKGTVKVLGDKSAERSYIENGFIRNLRPRKRSILFQQPDIYVVVKKRMFSSLVNNSRLDYLEKKERILIAASKKLFQNKCKLISAYEKLTKIEKLAIDSGSFNTFLGPSFINLIDSLDTLGGATGLFSLDASTKSAIETLRKVLSYSMPTDFTSWTTNWDASFSDEVGEGPGTMELTIVSSISTKTSVEWGGGSANLTLEDPYNLLTITEQDIDQALTDVTNVYREGGFFKFTKTELENTIRDLQGELAVERRSRNASNITFKISPGTVVSKRVRAILDDESTDIRFQYSTGLSGEDGSVGEVLSSVFVSIGNTISGGNVEIEPEFLEGYNSINVSINNQLTKSEQKKFVQIIGNIFTLLGYNQTSKAELNQASAEINYARNRMRLFFNGKYVIQPMDVITIFMSSRTSEDDRLPGGFQKQQNESGFSLINRFDTILKNINNTVGDMQTNGKLETIMSFEDIERSSMVGAGFPKWLWRQFKQDITCQPTGPCIFTGLVGAMGQGVVGTWSDGKWTVSVTCNDNSAYFSQGYINFQPSADVLNASIYDPLTPFDVSLDASTGTALTDTTEGDLPQLLPENKMLIQTGLLTYGSGPEKGNSVTEENLKQQTSEITFGKFRNVLHAPNGLVYRWKQGIQTLTWLSKPENSTEENRAVLLTPQPFAGQDVMNVISMLVTGQPYNYDTFLKAAIANGNSLGSNDNISNITAATTYIQGLLNDIEKTNCIWGNFIPYKKLVMNPSINTLITQTRLDAVSNNEQLTKLLRERASVEDEIMMLADGFNVDLNSLFTKNEAGQSVLSNSSTNTIETDAATDAKRRLDSIDEQINNLQGYFDKKYKESNNQEIGLTIMGTDVNTNLTSVNDASSSNAQKQRDELELRRNLFRFTARRFWKVKANEDQNLFIVDDQYDKNFDLMAFERKIGSTIKLFDSPYSSVADQINNVKKLLGFEVFANTQGHIEARPPGYNKVPSSVFYKMFKDRDTKGTKVFPDFLESLYFNQSKALLTQIEIIEDEIRLRAVALGANNDDEIIKLIVCGSNIGTYSSADFGFLTTFDGGIQNIPAILTQIRPEYSEHANSQGLTSVKDAKEQLSKYQQNISIYLKKNRLFTISTQIKANKEFNTTVDPDQQATIVEKIRIKLRNKTGLEPKNLSDLFTNDRFRRLETHAVSRSDRLNLFLQIGSLISQRQTLLYSLSNAMRSFVDGLSINTPDEKNQNIFSGGLSNLDEPTNSNAVGRSIATPNLNRHTEIPEYLEHMIEYENDDNLGVNSGRRFIITADRIVSLTISENAPQYTMISVNGMFAEGLVDSGSSFKTNFDGKNESNLMSSAIAVDYDMWYQYGFKVPTSIEAPFLSDPDSQCAPYAYATLLQARENILQGSVQITGYNEFYQPGDVVYIEDRNLLFYVRGVQHNFSYGQLNTTLDLSYGHNSGEYIPTMLDVVGKILYNSRGFTGRFRNERYQMLGASRSLGALTIENKISFTESISENNILFSNTEPMVKLLSGRNGERNKNILTNTLFAISGNFNQTGFGTNKTRIKIVYYKTQEDTATYMAQLATAVLEWLVSPEKMTPDGLSADVFMQDGTGNQKVFGINAEDIIIEEVDLTNSKQQTRRRTYPENKSPEPNTQGPSSAAIAATRVMSASDIKPTQFSNILASCILDLFVDYEDVKETISQSDDGSEYGQQSNASIDEARQIGRIS